MFASPSATITSRYAYRARPRRLAWSVALVLTAVIAVATPDAGAVTPGFNFAQVIPTSSPSGEFSSISCATPTTCVAVGGSSTSLPLVAFESNSVWNSATTVDITDATLTSIRGNFRSVSCPTSTTCVAVGVAGGTTTNGSARFPLVGVWSNGIWTLRVLTADSGDAYFNAVSCVDNNHCTAVGSNTNGDYVTQSMARQDWSAEAVRAGNDPNDGLAAVTCSDSVNCVAVGTTVVASRTVGAVLREVNGVWQSVVSVSGTVALSGVSCPSTTTCFAVGFATVAVGLHGVWSVPTSQPSLGRGHVLSGISCVDTNHCVAVGFTSISNEPLSVSFDNGMWSGASSSTTPGGQGTFSATQCFAANVCVAAGSQTSPFLPIVATTGTDVPNAPTGLTVTPGNGQLSAHWTAEPASESGGDPIDAYVVSDSTGQSCQSTTTSCVLSGVPNDAPETVSIVAHNAVGNSLPASTTGILFASPSTSFGVNTAFPVELAATSTAVYVAHAAPRASVTVRASTVSATCVANAFGECIALLGSLRSNQYVITAQSVAAGVTYHASPVALSVATASRTTVNARGVTSTIVSLANGVPRSVMVVVHGGDNAAATTTLSSTGAGSVTMKGTGVFAVSDAGVSLTVG